MQIERSIAWVDIEGSGVDPNEDRIVELAVVLLRPDLTRKDWAMRFNPGIPIPSEATAVHGITDEDVKDCPPFSAWARKIWAGLQGKDLGGYNLRRYDLPILDAEFRRADPELKLDLTGVRVIDCFGIFARKEERSLSAAVRKFCGREHDGAHGALADTQATVDVFLGQLAAYPDLDQMPLEELAEFSRNSDKKEADLAGKLYYDGDGDLAFAFGKYRGKKVRDWQNYADWMINKGNFPMSTIEFLVEELRRIDEAAYGGKTTSTADVPF